MGRGGYKVSQNILEEDSYLWKYSVLHRIENSQRCWRVLPSTINEITMLMSSSETHSSLRPEENDAAKKVCKVREYLI